MKLFLIFCCLIPSLVLAGTVPIKDAGISLEVSEEWVEIPASPNAELMKNLCFPQLRYTKGGSRIFASIWRPARSLDEALDAQIPHMLGQREGETHEKISRTPFRTKSGIEGVRYAYNIKLKDPEMRHAPRLVYVFRNKQSTIISLGAYGNLEEVDRIVLSSLKRG